jgi:5-methyltetrahydropteroyltriglutamate--homocysteine methyltransferase
MDRDMKRSTNRILTTHTGSLTRPRELLEMIGAGDMKRRKDEAAFQEQVRAAVADIVRLQCQTGIDVVNDGEQGRVTYATYVKQRLSGFGGTGSPITCADLEAVPDYRDRYMGAGGAGARIPMGGCNGPVSYTGMAELGRDIDNLKQALAGQSCQEAFMSAASPGVIAHFLDNEYYPSDEAYLMALADAMKTEYERLHQAGFILQVDCPDLAMARVQKKFAQMTTTQFCAAAELRVAALNRAVGGIPPEAMRLHLCWGNYEGPHHFDVELKEMVNIVFKARPAGIVLEACNPRHEHEWQLFEKVKLPPCKLMIPGVIDTVTNFVEHPELVAQRIERWAKIVGRENVIAGTDCGFASVAGFMPVHPEIAWMKLKSLVEGARLASARLW